MESALPSTIRLSTRLTFALSYLVPALWLALVGFGLLGAFSQSGVQAALTLILAVVGLIWFRATAFQLCNVWANPEGLIVVRRGQRTLVPYGSIRGAHQRHAFGFTKVLLSQPTALGQVVLFVPYLAQLFPYQAEHPAALLIQQRAAHATAGGV